MEPLIELPDIEKSDPSPISDYNFIHSTNKYICKLLK